MPAPERQAPVAAGVFVLKFDVDKIHSGPLSSVAAEAGNVLGTQYAA